MAVYTEISAADFESLLSRYNIGSFLNAKGIVAGVSNTNYLLETTTNKYIVTVYEHTVDEADLPFFLNLMEHLSLNGIPSPLPLHEQSEEVLTRIHDRPAAIVSFLQGKSPRTIKNHHCREVGRIMAKMHIASQHFGIKRKNDMSLIKWKELFSSLKINNAISEEIASDLSYLSENWPKSSSLPSGIIHADLFPDNVFFNGEKLSGLLDFYYACNDFFVYDIAIALNAWCFEIGAEFNITKAKALLSGYEGVRKFTEEELKVLPLLAAGAAMRFLLTRLYDELNQIDGAVVTLKNPYEYLQKLRFHRQVKSIAEYGL